MFLSLWKRFRYFPRAWISFWLFLSLTLISGFAPFLANDKPLLVISHHKIFLPFIQQPLETEFGGELEIPMNFRDEYGKILLKDAFVVWPLIPYGPWTLSYGEGENAPAAPSWRHWLGTDDHGRDVLSRLLYGMRTSLFFGICLSLSTLCISLFVGGISGYFGGLTDLVLFRFVEIWSGLPVLYLLILLSSLVDPGFWWLLGIMALFKWTTLVPTIRAEFLRARTLDYVRAAEGLGVTQVRIMGRHILPNALIASLSNLPFVLNISIATLTSLDFLGFGLPTGSPSLGELLAQGKNNIYAPWLGLTGFCAVASLLTLMTFIGEGVRDALDPRRSLLNDPSA